jgi:phosphohistidine phosphatase
MRTLLLMRHAKSSWKDDSLADEDRPLNERGRLDAVRMGKFLRKNGLAPDFILTSTAKRARQTAKRVSTSGKFVAPIEECGELYFSGPEAYVSRIAEVPPTVRTLLVIGHNPDLEVLAGRLTGESAILPTAAIARIELKAESWRDLSTSETSLLKSLYRPKDLAGGR